MHPHRWVRCTNPASIVDARLHDLENFLVGRTQSTSTVNAMFECTPVSS